MLPEVITQLSLWRFGKCEAAAGDVTVIEAVQHVQNLFVIYQGQLQVVVPGDLHPLGGRCRDDGGPAHGRREGGDEQERSERPQDAAPGAGGGSDGTVEQEAHPSLHRGVGLRHGGDGRGGPRPDHPARHDRQALRQRARLSGAFDCPGVAEHLGRVPQAASGEGVQGLEEEQRLHPAPEDQPEGIAPAMVGHLVREHDLHLGRGEVARRPLGEADLRPADPERDRPGQLLGGAQPDAPARRQPVERLAERSRLQRRAPCQVRAQLATSAHGAQAGEGGPRAPEQGQPQTHAVEVRRGRIACETRRAGRRVEGPGFRERKPGLPVPPGRARRTRRLPWRRVRPAGRPGVLPPR